MDWMTQLAQYVPQTPQEAVELIYTTPLWDASIRKFAAI